MTPEEIANHLIAHHNQPHFPHILEQFRPHINTDVLEAVQAHISDERRRNAQQAFQWLQVLKAIAEIIETTEAHARALWIQGTVLLSLNRYHEAITCFQQLEPYYHQQGELLKVAGMKINQVLALRELGEYQKALALAEEAQIMCSRIGEPAERYLANLKTAMGWVYQEMGNIKTALAVYEQACTIYTKLGLEASLASINLSQAHVYQSIDRFEEAEILLTKARSILRQNNHHQAAARTDLNLGILAYNQSQYQIALHHLEAAFTGFNNIPLPIEVANVNLRRALVYHRLYLIQEMMTLAAEAKEVFQQNKMHREHIMCLTNLASGHWQLGDLVKAKKLLDQARRKIYKQGAWWKLWLIDIDRAQLALEMENPTTAYRIARRTENQVQPAQHPSLAARLDLLMAQSFLAQNHPESASVQKRIQQAIDLARTYHLSEILIEAHHLLGTFHEKMGNHKTAWEQIKHAIQICEQLRLYLSQDELHMGFMVNRLPIYHDYLRLTHYLAHAQRIPLAHLLESLNLMQTAPLPHVIQPTFTTTTLTTEEQEQLDTLRQRWRWFQNKLEAPDNFAQTPKGAVTRNEIRQTLQEIERDLADLLRRQRIRQDRSTSTTQSIPTSPEAFLTALQQQLSPQQIILQYYMVNEQLQALLITHSTLHTIPDLVSTKMLHRLLQSWRFHIQHIQATPHASENGLKMAQAYLARLYQVLIAPLFPYLNRNEHIYLIVPPGWHELPLAALFDGQHYLVEHHPLTYLSNPGALLTSHPAPLPSHSRQALVVGYSENGRLPHTLTETDIVMNTLSPAWQIHPLIEGNATLANFRDACQNSHLLHLATHATFRPDNPYFSWIRLADARLTVADLYDIPLPHRPFVVLSACETGRGQARGGGLLSMGRGFLAAGAAGLIVTTWRISDTHSAQVMSHFYQALAYSPTAATTALHKAQNQAIAANQHPFFWAGFAYIGG